MDTEVSLYDHLYYQEDQWSQHTLLSQEPIPLLDNGYGGESLWSSLLWSWSTEPGPSSARSPSLSYRQWLWRWVFFMIIFFIKKVNRVSTLLSREPIPLLDNGYGGESLWSSFLKRRSVESEPNSAKSPSLSLTMVTEVSLFDDLFYQEDQWSQHIAQPGAIPSPWQWIWRWVFMIIFIYQEDQWSQHVAQPGTYPSPRQWLRRWVFMITFGKSWSTELGPNWARSPSLS